MNARDDKSSCGTREEPSPLGLLDTDDPAGYRLVSQLGVGGFGTVFRAVQESTGQIVALKILRRDAELDDCDQQRQAERFDRETQLCAELSHPHIVNLLDKGQTQDGQFYAVFEYVPGETLKEFLLRRGPLSALEAGELMGQVLDALASMHAHGIVHRDLKPQNIMVSSTGVQVQAKVLDFGIGALIPDRRQADYKMLTLTREVMGTPSYSAPEQLRGEPPTVKSDLYAWGLVFLECLTGRPAVRGQTLAEIYHQQLSAADVVLPLPIAGHALGHLLRRTLRKDPRDRAEHASQVYADCRQINLGTLVGDLSPVPSGDVGSDVGIDETLQHVGLGYTLYRERRQITVLCCNLNLQIDQNVEPDGETIEFLEALQRDQLGVITDIAVKHGGYVAGELGGSVMVYFGYPDVSDTDAQRAARTALELIDQAHRHNQQLQGEPQAQLECRLGLHTGMEVTKPGRAPTGLTPNLASRLGHLAPPGAVLVSDATHQLLEQHWVFKPFEPWFDGNGKMPVNAFTFTGEKRAEARPYLPGEKGERPLVARQSEYAMLRRMWADAQRGEGGGVLMTGEPGIGKSRLVDEVRRLVNHEGGMVLDCGCLPEDQNHALYPILELLKRRLHLPEVGSIALVHERLQAALDGCHWPVEIAMPILCSWLGVPIPSPLSPVAYTPKRQKQILLDVLEQLLFNWGDEQPFVLIVEDLHWVDLTTMEWLERLIKSVSSRKCLLLLTARTGFSPPWPLGQLQTLPLQRLADHQARAMVQQVLDGQTIADDSMTRLLERIDGIPLFAEELIRMWLDRDALTCREGSYVLSEYFDERSIPITLRDMLNERLGKLGLAKETAQMAAAIGRTFDYKLLVHASFRNEARVQADLDQLIAADLVDRVPCMQGDRFVFRHALLRDAIYEGMPKAMREQAHSSITGALATCV